MRLIIDGYNVMHAAGLMQPRFAPNQFRHARQRFLGDLAVLLEEAEVGKTTVVFDAKNAPAHLPPSVPHKGLTALFAVDVPDADERIEALIRVHSTPKTLTVVSSDLRIRKATQRRKARALTADEFLVELDRRRSERPRLTLGSTPQKAPEPPPPQRPADPAEAAHWRQVFGELDAQPETAEALRGRPGMIDEDDLRRIAREVEAEFRSNPDRPPRRRR